MPAVGDHWTSSRLTGRAVPIRAAATSNLVLYVSPFRVVFGPAIRESGRQASWGLTHAHAVG